MQFIGNKRLLCPLGQVQGNEYILWNTRWNTAYELYTTTHFDISGLCREASVSNDVHAFRIVNLCRIVHGCTGNARCTSPIYIYGVKWSWCVFRGIAAQSLSIVIFADSTSAFTSEFVSPFDVAVFIARILYRTLLTPTRMHFARKSMPMPML